MNHFHNERIVRAIIPHTKDPNRHIVHKTGQYPEIAFHPNHRTYEGSLDRIGHAIGARALSPDRRIFSTPEITYLTKPVDLELLPESEYRWQVTE